MYSAITPCVLRRGCNSDETWTPSALLAFDDSMEMDEFGLTEENNGGPVQVFNSCIDSLADAARKPKIDPLESQVACWESCPKAERSAVVQKTEQVCQLLCDVIAPNDGEQLFQAVIDQHNNKTEIGGVGLKALVVAYQNAPSRSVKTQILSIYADRFTKKELKEIHKPFEDLSERQIKKARAQAKIEGPGIPVERLPRHRIRVDQRQLDHFLEFSMRPYYYQDVAYGTRTLKLESGEELVMPNVVRTVARCTIINQYLEHCKETGFNPISNSTMWRVLDVQEASQRKSLRGLDNTAADGADGFKDLLRIVDELEHVGAAKDWCEQARKKLREGKLYLKTKYCDHCREDGSSCPDHCRVFALSDASDADYQDACSHTHDMACADCESLKSIVEEVESAIPKYEAQLGKDQTDDLQHDAKGAAFKIFEWKAHILRAQNQDQAKQQILNSIEEDEVVIVVDWAMKFTVMKFREKQAEWFAKRGINWHVSSVITRREESLEVTCYVHLLDSCRQDWFAVLSILENLLFTIKLRHPGIIKAYLRSDEAGCYHNSKLVSSFRELGYRQGIEIVRYDHSEPQSGKDMCDRILCPIKAAIRRYCNEGHDVVSAQDMHTALKERPVKGTTATVCAVQEQYTTLEIRKIPNYSNLHNFEFTKEGLRVWRAFNVGPGKFIPWNDIVICPQRKSDLMEKIPFFLTTARQFTSKEQSRADLSEDKLYECPEPSCNEEFQSRSDLDLHMNMFGHQEIPRQPGKECLYDKLRRDWVSHFQTLTMQGKGLTGASAAVKESLSSTPRLLKGWALHKKCRGARFPEKVRRYLIHKFNIGQGTGRKEDPAQVAKDMRTASTIDGERMFDRTEWLSKCQIQGFFSRLSASIKQGHQMDTEPTESEKEDTDAEELDDLVEEYACDIDEERLRDTTEVVLGKIGLTHPILYDIYDLCTLSRDGKLPSFKVPMLREMCKHFDLSVRSKDTKAVLLSKMKEMISECSCNAMPNKQ